MLDVVIIDDEDYIREGLKRIIDWNKYGFRICGEAGNGSRGLARIREFKPDLVIVDIRMPLMDGLEMIKALRSENSTCEFIVLTAYSDFKYAQTAIELGIDSYVLKPIEQAVLIEKISRVYDKIMDKRQTRQNIDMSIHITKERILQSILLDQIDAQMLDKYNSLSEFGFPWSSYRVALVEMEEAGRMDASILKANVKKQIEIIISESKLGYVFDMDRYIAILINNCRLKANIRVLHELPDNISRLCGTNVTIMLGIVAERFTDIPSSYKNACRLSESKFILGYKRIISDTPERSNADGASMQTNHGVDVLNVAESLYKAADAGNMGLINDVLEKVFQEFLSGQYSEDIIKVNYTNIYSAAVNKLVSTNPGMREKLEIKQEILTEICRKSSLQELHGYIKYIFAEISAGLEGEKPDDPMKKILEYIERNYSRDIKLESLAALFNYSCDHLGRKIKSRTGRHFNTYLDTVRLEKAKQFLKEGSKVYQAAQKSGFKDINYFYKKFKSYTGVSPSDYRDKLADTHI